MCEMTGGGTMHPQNETVYTLEMQVAIALRVSKLL